MARNPPLATVLPFDVVDEAWRLALAPALAAAVTLPFLPPVGIGLLALAFGVLWFHRDPDRSTPDAEGIVVAPPTELSRSSARRANGSALACS